MARAAAEDSADLRSWVADLRTLAAGLRSWTQVVLPWPADLRSWAATLQQCPADMCPTAAHQRSTAATCPLHPTRVDLQGDQLAEAGVTMPEVELRYKFVHLHVR